MIPMQLSGNGVPTKNYSVNAFFEGKSYLFAGQLGFTYAFNDMISVYAGARMNMASNTYIGHLKGISVNPSHPALNPSGQMMLANKFFTDAKNAAQSASSSLQPAINGGAGEYTLNQMVASGQMSQAQVDQLAGGLGLSPQTAGALMVAQVQGLYNQAAETYDSSAKQTADKNVDCTQSGMGITPLLGLNLNFDKLNIGIKYEFLTSMEIKNETKKDDTGMFTDGVKTPNDIPALLTLAASYDIMPNVKVSAGFHHYFDSNAKMAKVKDPNNPEILVDKQKFINGGINEFQLGAEWQINKMFLVSAGGQVTSTGVKDAYQTDMSFSLNSYSLGFGGAINVTKRMRVNLAYFFTNYNDWTKESSKYAGLPLPGKDVFSRTNKAFGIGIDYRF
jgi:hypothetical protein